MNLGIYDMQVEVPEDAPKAVRIALNKNICNGGGGGGSSTTVSGIDAEFKPDIQYGLGLSKSLLESQINTPGSVVEGFDQRQADAINEQTRLAEDQIAGTGIYDTRAAEQGSLLGLVGSNALQSTMGGNLGSARGQKALASALAGRAGEYQKGRQQMAMEGVQNLGDAGTTVQKQKQAELTEQDQAIDRFFGRLTGAAPRTSTTTTSGGGK